MQAIEHGVVTVLARPRVDVATVRDLGDVQRLFVLLHPVDGPLRRLVIGRKTFAEPGARSWAFVDAVGDEREVARDLATHAYVTKTRGVRVQHAAQTIAEGRYALVRHDDHVHLDLALDPRANLRLPRDASFIVLGKDERRRFRHFVSTDLALGAELVLVEAGSPSAHAIALAEGPLG